MSVFGIIPARGGSKGIPRKNIKLLLGKPLIVWSIEAAKESRLIDDFIVSTDDDEITGIAVAAGATVIMRPPELATDDATTLDVMKHHLTDADTIILLQPTSPVRVNRIIDTALSRFRVVECDTLASGYMSTHVAWGGTVHGPRQKQKAYFHDDGCIYIFKREVIAAGKWIGDKPHNMIVPAIYNLEIDTLADFWAVEGILEHVQVTVAG